MSGGLKQLNPANMGRNHRLVTTLDLFVLQEGFQGLPQYRALRGPQGQTRADFIGKDKQPQVFTEFAVISAFWLLRGDAYIPGVVQGFPRPCHKCAAAEPEFHLPASRLRLRFQDRKLLG